MEPIDKRAYYNRPVKADGIGGDTNCNVTSILEISGKIDEAAKNISEADPGDVPKIASEQIKIISEYYLEVLKQSKESFLWAKRVAMVGFAFFIGAVIFLLVFQLQNMATISLIAGALIEISSGIGFYLYSKSIFQMADYFKILDTTQRYLLANSMCEGLEDCKDETRSAIIKQLANVSMPQHEPIPTTENDSGT